MGQCRTLRLALTAIYENKCFNGSLCGHVQLLSVRQIKETFSQFRRVVLDMQEEFSEGGKSLVVPSQAHLSTSQPVERKHSRTSKTGKVSASVVACN